MKDWGNPNTGNLNQCNNEDQKPDTSARGCGYLIIFGSLFALLLIVWMTLHPAH